MSIGETANTADRADAYVRRQAMLARILGIFQEHRPTGAELEQVATLAEVAIEQVFAARHVTAEQSDERHGQVHDYAECAALYGYVVGLWQARRELVRP